MSIDENGVIPEEYELNAVGESLYTKKRSVLGLVLNIIIVLFVVILFFELLFNMFFTGIYVVNISMQPTFIGAESENVSGGDFIYINTSIKQPEYGDVVVVYRETKNHNGTVDKGNIIKRVVAFGGDTIRLDRGVLYVNDEIVDESYLYEGNNTPSLPINSFSTHTVKEGCMFLLGDNRNKSTDSRENGDYPIDNLLGVVPKWSQDIKGFTTAIYTFFNFTIYGK